MITNNKQKDIFLTQAQYDAREQGGTLEVGAIYHITDALIDENDLSQSVLESLALANTALQPDGISIERLSTYLCKASYITIPQEEELNTQIQSGCTSFVRNGKLYRNLDWNYDEAVEFLVECKGFKGMSFISTITNDNFNIDLIKQLPYHINDGINEYGIMVSSHVLYNDFNFVGSGNTLITKIPYIILTTLQSMGDINLLNPYLADLKLPQQLIDSEYVMQFLITDGTTTYIMTPSDNGYELVNISALPKLANFKWINKASIQRNDNDLQSRPNGIERWNLIGNNTKLKDLRFTLAYEDNSRLSEFIGINDTTKDSTDAELEAIYTIAHQEYLDRERDGYTWQTVHSIIYSKEGVESLYIQENYDRNFANNTQEIVETLTESEISQHDVNPYAHNDIRANIEDVREVAQGKTTNYVCSSITNPILDSENDIITLTGNLTDIHGQTITIAQLKEGDNIYVSELTVYDRWYAGDGKLYVLETEKVPVSDVQFKGTTVVVSGIAHIPSTLSDFTEDSTHRLVTDTEKSTWNAKQNAINANNKLSYNFLTDTPAVVNESTVINWGFTKNTGNYNKPSGGIPKSDLASAVQTSLNLADSALQSFTETDPTVPSWAKEPNKPTYNYNELQGTAPEPSAYIKSASVNGNSLTLTKKDNTTQVFTPSFTEQHIGDVVSVTTEDGLENSGTSTNPKIGVDSNHKLPTNTEWGNKEDNSNKVQTIDNSSTQSQYPSAQAVYEFVPQVLYGPSDPSNAQGRNGDIYLKIVE